MTHKRSSDDVSVAVVPLRLSDAVAELFAPRVPVPEHRRHQRDQLVVKVGRLRAWVQGRVLSTSTLALQRYIRKKILLNQLTCCFKSQKYSKAIEACSQRTIASAEFRNKIWMINDFKVQVPFEPYDKK